MRCFVENSLVEVPWVSYSSAAKVSQRLRFGQIVVSEMGPSVWVFRRYFQVTYEGIATDAPPVFLTDPLVLSCPEQHDSLVVPANLRLTSRETFLTVGGGAHRYSRFGKSQRSRPRGNFPRQGATCMRNLREGGSPGDGGEGFQEGVSEGWRLESSGFELSPFPAIDAILR